jgi:RsiW-degrading membrane proteinase PrsW (M82 family)
MDAIGEFLGDFAVAMISGLLVVMIGALCAAIWGQGRGPGPAAVVVGSAALGLLLAAVSLVLHDNVWLVGTGAVLVVGLIGAWIIALRSDPGR